MSARSNGLRARAYSVLIEIEESLGDQMLDALAERQIAAYVVPAPGPGRTSRLILHVDAQRRIPAGIVLAELTPAPAGDIAAESEASESPASRASTEDDAAFAAIVADFYRPAPERTWPASEDVAPEPPPFPTVGPFPVVDRRRPSITVTPTPASSAGKKAPDPDPDEPDHYVAPDLPRLAPSPPATRWAFFALGLGLALMLLPTLFSFGHRTSLDIAGVGCVLGGTCVLLARLRDRSDDDPDDDGAVV